MTVPTTPQITSPADGAVVSGVITVAWSASTLPDVVAPGFIASTAQVFAPTVVAGAAPNTVVPSFIASTAQVFAPEVVEGGGVTVYAQDDFTDTDNVLLDAHTPTWGGGAGSGGAWVRTSPGGGAQTNRIYQNALAVSAGGGNVIYHQDDPGVANYAIEVEDETLSTDFIDYRVHVRYNPTTVDYYRFYRTNVGWQIYKTVGGSQAALGAAISDTPVATEVNTYLFEAETTAPGEVTLRIKKNGVEIGSRTDSSSPLLGGAGAQYVGLWNDGGVTTGHKLRHYRVLSL